MNHKILSILFVGFLFFGCKVQKTNVNFANSTNNNIPKVALFNTTVDYSINHNWAVSPGNYPDNLKEFATQKPLDSIDVFYVYPTLITSKSDTRWNVSIEDSLQRKKVLNTAVHFQASAWANTGNLYVPYYRQAHIRSYADFENGGENALLNAYSDVKASFEYYLKHYNQGKGIVLVGHSQGSTHLSKILNDFFDGKPLQKQLVAAYIPGIGFNKNQFGTIKFMDKPDQIGGFVTWNTFKKKFDKKNYKWYKGKAVINPITWDTTKTSKRALHKGFLFSNGKMYKNSFDTHLDNGVIWISTPHFPFRYLTFAMRNYHAGDINLFWENIRINSLLRAKTYLESKKTIN
ncbi:DUF3089 domain-containing protein [Flavobacterium sp.]|uniref:DUF3089 domain-containing protein n=1 Tax=Flavobacterium sp. TaxID=239 RepID=UPI00286C4463|nr:DUF3089 domain-containing protein [Flavobacterium sp.]